MKIKYKKSEKGFALALALMMLVVMSIMGATIMQVVSNDHKANGLKNHQQQAFYAAETGIAEAKIVICATNKISVSKAIGKIIKEKYPHVEFMIRTKNRYDAYELLNLGNENIYRESLETSLTLAKDVLSKMGFRKYTLNRQVQNFIKYDEDSLRRLSQEPKDKKTIYLKLKKNLSNKRNS